MEVDKVVKMVVGGTVEVNSREMVGEDRRVFWIDKCAVI